jgi:serine/threonine protein kinase
MDYTWKKLTLGGTAVGIPLPSTPPLTLFTTVIDEADTSKVFYATDEHEKTYAVKSYDLKKPEEARDLEDDFELLSKYPEVCPKTYPPIKVDNTGYLAMDLYNCGSLRNSLADSVAIPEGLLPDFVFFMGEALAKLDHDKVFHGSICPGHILVHEEKDGTLRFKLLGLHKSIQRDSLRVAPYLAPEGPRNIASDVWSLGIVVYEMVMSVRPNELKLDFQLERQKGKPLSFPESISSELQHLLEKCLAYDPAARITPEQILSHKFTKREDLDDFQKAGGSFIAAPPVSAQLPGQITLLEYLRKLLVEKKLATKLRIVERPSLAPYTLDKGISCDAFSSHFSVVKNGRPCILKILQTGDYETFKCADQLIEEILRREMMKNSALMIELIEYFVYQNKLHLVLADYSSVTLEQYIQGLMKEGKTLPIPEILRIVQNVATSLKELHDSQIYQATLHPRNLLVKLGKDGALTGVKLVDFAIPHLSLTNFTSFQQVECLAPELITQTPFYGHESSEAALKVGPAADSWSLGLLINYLQTKKPFYSSLDDLKNFIETGDMSLTIDEGFNEDLTKLRAFCLRADPATRIPLHEVVTMPVFVNVFGEIMDRVGEYTMMELLGTSLSGGSKVFRCQKDGSYYAAKLINFAVKNTPREKAYMMMEVKTLVKLRGVPHAVQLFDFYHHDKILYLIMTLANGGDLETYVLKRNREKKPIDATQQEFIVYCVLSVLYRLHSNVPKVIHRDIHPKNILLCVEEADFTQIKDVLLADFGIARALESANINVTRLGAAMSPELYQKDQAAQPGQAPVPPPKIDEKTDIWSLGTLIFFLIYGKYIDKHMSLAQIMNPTGSLKFPNLPPTSSKPLEIFMKQCLSKVASNRPSAQDLLRAPLFEKFQKGKPEPSK